MGPGNTVPPAAESACGNCHYYRLRFTKASEQHTPSGRVVLDVGECRYDPPRVISQNQDPLSTQRWPLVVENDWCGCHYPKGDS